MTQTRRQMLGIALAATAVSVPAFAAAPPDPLIDLIERYRERMSYFNANAKGSDENYDALADATYVPLWDELGNNPPAPTTYAGAIAGLEFTAVELKDHGDAAAVGAVLARCLDFLRGGSQA